MKESENRNLDIPRRVADDQCHETQLQEGADVTDENFRHDPFPVAQGTGRRYLWTSPGAI